MSADNREGYKNLQFRHYYWGFPALVEEEEESVTGGSGVKFAGTTVG